MTKRIIGSIVLASLLFVGSSSTAFATETTAVTGDLAALQAKVQMLMAQIESLKAMSMKQGAQIEELRAELKISKRLRQGDKGDEVKTLQEMLATDPSLFPEGKVTGFFGPLTAKALKRFQEKAGLEGVGEVGPKTLELLNKFLAQGGAGNSGKVPEGLLKKAGGMITVPLQMQNNSGLKGHAMIADNMDGKAVVRIQMMMKHTEGSEGEEGKMQMMRIMGTSTYPAHIHLGACPTPGAVAYPLTGITGGMSETVLSTSTRSLIAGLPLAINVHKSAAEMSAFVACGDLKAPQMLWKKGEENKGHDNARDMIMINKEHRDNDMHKMMGANTATGTHQ